MTQLPISRELSKNPTPLRRPLPASPFFPTAWYGVPDELVHVIPYGVEASTFKPDAGLRDRRRRVWAALEERPQHPGQVGRPAAELGEDAGPDGLGEAAEGPGPEAPENERVDVLEVDVGDPGPETAHRDHRIAAADEVMAGFGRTGRCPSGGTASAGTSHPEGKAVAGARAGAARQRPAG